MHPVLEQDELKGVRSLVGGLEIVRAPAPVCDLSTVREPGRSARRIGVPVMLYLVHSVLKQDSDGRQGVSYYGTVFSSNN